MAHDDVQDPDVLRWSTLQPYVSVVVLECIGDDPEQAFGALERFLSSPERRRSGGDVRIVALSRSTQVGSNNTDGVSLFADLGVDQLAGLVRQRQSRPSWAGPDSPFVDTVHDLTVALRRGRLVAVHADGATEAKLQRWIDRMPRPPFSRIPAVVLERALLQGEAKGLWLRGTHRPRPTRPDSKHISGQRLQDALNPFEDSSFALGSARSDLAEHADRLVLKGPVGTTPRHSLVWFKATADFETFATAVVELLIMLEKALTDGHATAGAIPFLAREVSSLSDVRGAYEVTFLDPQDIPLLSIPGANDDLRAAAALLQRAVLDVRGDPGSARFVLDVGLNGAIGGSLGVRPRAVSGGYELDIGFQGEPTDPRPVREVLDALGHGELLTAYYRSGHAYTAGRIWQAKVPVTKFPNWEFADFDEYRIAREARSIRLSADFTIALACPAMTLYSRGSSLGTVMAG